MENIFENNDDSITGYQHKIFNPSSNLNINEINKGIYFYINGQDNFLNKYNTC